MTTGRGEYDKKHIKMIFIFWVSSFFSVERINVGKWLAVYLRGKLLRPGSYVSMVKSKWEFLFNLG